MVMAHEAGLFLGEDQCTSTPVREAFEHEAKATGVNIALLLFGGSPRRTETIDRDVNLFAQSTHVGECRRLTNRSVPSIIR